MIDAKSFAHRQMELTTEFARYILDNPDVDAAMPQDSYVYFEVDGETEFNEYSRQLAERREREDGLEPVCIRLNGLAPPQGSRLIDPEVITGSSVA